MGIFAPVRKVGGYLAAPANVPEIKRQWSGIQGLAGSVQQAPRLAGHFVVGADHRIDFEASAAVHRAAAADALLKGAQPQAAYLSMSSITAEELRFVLLPQRRKAMQRACIYGSFCLLLTGLWTWKVVSQPVVYASLFLRGGLADDGPMFCYPGVRGTVAQLEPPHRPAGTIQRVLPNRGDLVALLMPSRERPDDSSGRSFQKALRTIEQREPSRPFEHVEVVWRSEPPASETCEQRAVVGDYMLLVVEASEEFLANEPPQMPRISWSVYRGKGWEETLVGAPAPSIEIAKARAETLWRAFLGYKRA